MGFTQEMAELRRRREAGEISPELYRRQADALLDKAVGPVTEKAFSMVRVVTGRWSGVRWYVDGGSARVGEEIVCFSQGWMEDIRNWRDGDEVAVGLMQGRTKPPVMLALNLSTGQETSQSRKLRWLITVGAASLLVLAFCLLTAAVLAAFAWRGAWWSCGLLLLGTGSIALVHGFLACFAGVLAAFLWQGIEKLHVLRDASSR